MNEHRPSDQEVLAQVKLATATVPAWMYEGGVKPAPTDEKLLLGTLTLKATATFREDNSYAAWYQDTVCEPQTVDVYASPAYRSGESRYGTRAVLHGVKGHSDFASRFGGVIIRGSGGINEGMGQPHTHALSVPASQAVEGFRYRHGGFDGTFTPAPGVEVVVSTLPNTHEREHGKVDAVHTYYTWRVDGVDLGMVHDDPKVVHSYERSKRELPPAGMSL